MNRKEWLEKFLKLVKTNASMLGYRRDLRLFPKEVKRHLVKIGEYKKELAAILKEEKKKEDMRERLAKARAVKEKRRLQELEEKEKANEEQRRMDAESKDDSSESSD